LQPNGIKVSNNLNPNVVLLDNYCINIVKRERIPKVSFLGYDCGIPPRLPNIRTFLYGFTQMVLSTTTTQSKTRNQDYQ
jgi:hypothetical protein